MAKADPDPDSKYDKRYRQHVFQIATTLLHEIAHILITYIGRDGTYTPPELTGREGGSKGGRWLPETRTTMMVRYD